MSLITFLTIFSGASFLFFGLACFTSPQMKSEFERYGLINSRVWVGVLQLLGALGLLVGALYSPLIHAIAAIGLSVLMILGFLVRIRIRDSFIQSAPSLMYALLNTFIAILLWEGYD